MNILWIVVLLLSKLYFISVEIITYKTKWPFHIRRKLYAKPTRSPNYCDSQLCPKNVRHLTCDFQFWSPKCGKSHEGVKLRKGMQNIINMQNKVRHKLNKGRVAGLPRALNLPLLSWDDELAIMAMRITNQCNENRVGKFCVNTFRFPNVAETSDFMDFKKTPAKAMNYFIKRWSNNSIHVKPNHVSSFPAKATREMRMFANMAFSGADKVGCGMLDSGSKRFVTCVYNGKVMPGMRLYLTRPP
ncbi:venom allergen 3 [Drosophila madeirensis]|uniref:Venom allergen 3 n=1 Tax=Drosophila madeirensis TaxID=30013 RepID=A0AAU9F7K4_DROMD